MPWLRSQLNLIEERPWRWSPAPVFGNGPFAPPTVPGVKEFKDGVFFVLGDSQIAKIKLLLTPAQRTTLDSWTERHDEAWCTEWHVPVWAGESGVVGVQVPKAAWDNPKGAPPAQVKALLAEYWRG